MTKGVTCAVAIIDSQNRVLLVHPTGAKQFGGWSLPKGLKDSHETAAEAACREVFEETGVRITPDSLVDHGKFAYSSEKDYQLFSCRINTSIDTATLICESTFELNGMQIKEVDKYIVVPLNEATTYLNKKQSLIFETCFKNS